MNAAEVLSHQSQKTAVFALWGPKRSGKIKRGIGGPAAPPADAAAHAGDGGGGNSVHHRNQRRQTAAGRQPLPARPLLPSPPYLPPSWDANSGLAEAARIFTDTAQYDARFGLAAAFNTTSAAPASHHEAAKIAAQAARVKARNPRARGLMYLNLELALAGAGTMQRQPHSSFALPAVYGRHSYRRRRGADHSTGILG